MTRRQAARSHLETNLAKMRVLGGSYALLQAQSVQAESLQIGTHVEHDFFEHRAQAQPQVLHPSSLPRGECWPALSEVEQTESQVSRFVTTHQLRYHRQE